MLILVIINSTRLYLFNNVLLRHRMSIFIIWIWSRRNSSINIQKQPPEVFYKKRCSDKFHKIHRKTPASESFFNKVAGLRPEVRPEAWHRCFLANFEKFLRTPLLQYTSGRLLPNISLNDMSIKIVNESGLLIEYRYIFHPEFDISV